MRKKIGSGITDSNGVASCNYTGKAVGKMNVVAETKTDDRILQSETYEVCDCYVIDEATTGKKNDTDVWNYANRLQVSNPNDDGTTLTGTTSGAGGYYAFGKHGVSHSAWEDFIEYTGSFAFEIDIVSYDNNASGLFITNESNNTNFIRMSALTGLTSETNHLKVTFNGSKVYVYVNGETEPSKNYNFSANTSRVGIYVHNVVGTTFTYRNFKIYPI